MQTKKLKKRVTFNCKGNYDLYKAIQNRILELGFKWVDEGEGQFYNGFDDGYCYLAIDTDIEITQFTQDDINYDEITTFNTINDLYDFNSDIWEKEDKQQEQSPTEFLKHLEDLITQYNNK